MSTNSETTKRILERLQMGDIHSLCHRVFTASDVGDMTLEEIYDTIMNSTEVKTFIETAFNKSAAGWNVNAVIAWNFRMWIDGKIK